MGIKTKKIIKNSFLKGKKAKLELVKVRINNKDYEVEMGAKILDVCFLNEIPIASLCHHQDFEDNGILCRLCLVKERSNKEADFKFSPSCNLRAAPGLEVITNDPEIVRIRKTLLELLFMEHAGRCAHCFRNLKCELQALAIKYSIDQFRFVPKVAETDSEEALEKLRDSLARQVIDRSNPSIARESNKCIECRRCIKVCEEMQSVGALGTQKRGIEMGIGSANYAPLSCTFCGQCSLYCPTGSIIEKTSLIELVRALKDKDKLVVGLVAPAVCVSLGEEFGMLPGTKIDGKIISSLKKCGFDKVFNVSVGVDLAISEESHNLVDKLKKGVQNFSKPQIISQCPAAALFIKQNYLAIEESLSPVKSPELIMASIIKSYWAKKNKLDPQKIIIVSIVPCTAKKYEAENSSLISENKEIDITITTREIAHLINNFDIPFSELENGLFDFPFNLASGPNSISATTGGFTEAVLRNTYYLLTGKDMPEYDIPQTRGLSSFSEGQFQVRNKKIRFAISGNLSCARNIIEEISKSESEYDFVELMACPGGCIGGGGQPIPTNDKIRLSRMRALYEEDKNSEVRVSHNHPTVEKIYSEFLYKPGSRKVEKYLYRTINSRKIILRKKI